LPNLNGAIGTGAIVFSLFLFVVSFVTKSSGGFGANFICAVILGVIGIVLALKPSGRSNAG